MGQAHSRSTITNDQVNPSKVNPSEAQIKQLFSRYEVEFKKIRKEQLTLLDHKMAGIEQFLTYRQQTFIYTLRLIDSLKQCFPEQYDFQVVKNLNHKLEQAGIETMEKFTQELDKPSDELAPELVRNNLDTSVLLAQIKIPCNNIIELIISSTLPFTIQQEMLESRAQSRQKELAELEQKLNTLQQHRHELEQALVEQQDKFAPLSSLQSLFNVYMDESNLNQETIDQVELLRTKEIWFIQQLQALQGMVQRPNLLESACALGDMAALQQHLATEKAPVAFLQQQAPEALHKACRFGQVAIAQYLLKLGVAANQADAYGYYPLHAVMMVLEQDKLVDLLQLLLEAKATITQCGPYGRTALHTATLYGNQAAIAWLVQQQPALLNQAETGRIQKNTPLHNAAFGGFIEACRYLLEVGAQPKMRNHEDCTPLMEVLSNDQLTLETKFQVLQAFRQKGYWLSPDDIRSLERRDDYTTHIAPVIARVLQVMSQEITASQVIANDEPQTLVHNSQEPVSHSSSYPKRLFSSDVASIRPETERQLDSIESNTDSFDGPH
ncbi:MAG: hypothetical protein K0S11_1243 [Gammaproteobacteria bacterium]|nr:hypothetical protein [Gammaproteobacteria bacterium]